jgi:tetratricopeptide (TPR) repeat protein
MRSISEKLGYGLLTVAFLACATTKQAPLSAVPAGGAAGDVPAKSAATPTAAPAPAAPAAEVEAAQALFQKKDFEGAAKAYAALAAKEPDRGGFWLRLGLSHHFLNRYPEAISAYLRAAELKTAPELVSYNLGCAYALSGDKEKAILWLGRAADAGFSQLATMKDDADLASLRGDARFEAVIARVEKNSRPCDGPEHRKLDFWLGEWEVTAAGNPVGKNKIEPVLNGCALMESWVGAGGHAGHSFTLYNAATGRWEQTWVDARGAATYYSGNPEGASMVFNAEQPKRDGSKHLLKMTFTPKGADVEQKIEDSRDGGKTWNVSFLGLYRKKKP